MSFFAPGTSQQYADDYYRRVGPMMGGTGRDGQMPTMARPDSRNSVTVSNGRVSPYGQTNTRPFQGTMRPEVPQASQQAPDMSGYAPSRSAGMRWNGSQWTSPPPRPGRAQPTQPQSQGTPYNPGVTYYDPSGRPMPTPVLRDARNPGSAPMSAFDPSWLSPLASAEITRQQSTPRLPNQRHTPNDPIYTQGMPGYPQSEPPFRGGLQAPSFTPGGGQGNFAYAPPDQRPAPFTSTTRGPDGQQYDPGQYYPMRDAFIQNINDARSQFVSNPGAGRQPMDFGAMWGRAGDMAQQGFQNPLTGLLGGFG